MYPGSYPNLYRSHVHFPEYIDYRWSVYPTNSPMFYGANGFCYQHSFDYYHRIMLKDYGAKPFVVNINEASKKNNTFRTALWTGKHLQVTLMSIKVGEDIGLEIHPHVDQFLRIEQGQGIIQMGKRKEHLDFKRNVADDSAMIIPAGTWHNITNTGHVPLKLYSIYAPPNHPFGTVHVTKEDAQAAE